MTKNKECEHPDDAIKWMNYEGKTYLVCHVCGQQFIKFLYPEITGEISK